MSIPGDVEDHLRRDPTDGASEPVWSALARVVDDAPTYVLQDGDANGMSVTCRILSGKYAGVEVAAMVGSTLGGGFESRPIIKGMRVLLQFPEGTLTGLCVATNSVEGGRENPIPRSVAGVKVDADGLEKSRLYAPPKGKGDREYYRGGIKVFRLKGKQSDFFSGLVIECDDGAYFRVQWNAIASAYAIKFADAKGASFTVDDGFAVMRSPDGETSIEVSNGQILMNSAVIQTNASKSVNIDGNCVCLNMNGLLPTPANAVAFSPAGPVNLISSRCFVGL